LQCTTVIIITVLQCTTVIIITSPVHDEICIHITSIYCVSVFYVQLTKAKIVFISNKWVALTRASWCVVYVVDLLHAVSEEFSQGSVVAKLFRYGGKVYNFFTSNFFQLSKT